jgi:uroporphyrinogen decarboxylase
MKVPLKKPIPDKDSLKKVILREIIPKKLPSMELHIDKEMVKELVEKELDKKWIEPLSNDKESQKACLKNYIECWYRLGYDCLRLTGDFRFTSGLHFESKIRGGTDTAELARSERKWTEEGKGIISSWEDFEKYSWPSLDNVDNWVMDFVSANLPEGMGLFACPSAGIFEIGLNTLFGAETLSYLLYDNPELVKAVFDKAGSLIYDWYKSIIGMDKVIGFFQGDDLGYKTATIISPKFLREYILPWHKKIAQLAHDNGLVYILHSCGNLESIMEDVIKDVKIDAKHSFEDEIMPVAQFKEKYGNRIAVIGGVDVDKICRLDEPELRAYVRGIIDKCAPGGGYILGTGNSVANYIPLKSFLIMLDEGLEIH